VTAFRCLDLLALVSGRAGPSARSACRTEFDCVYAVQPILAAIVAIAAHCDV
jgi:hypothetical protein